MSISNEQQAALEQPIVRIVYFVEFSFEGGFGRFSTFNSTVEWNGYSWIGASGIVSIGDVEESEGATAKSLDFSLNAVQPELLALAAGSVTEYRGRSAKMWMCPLDENYQLLGEPQICWRGIMDMVTLGEEGETASIKLRCETSAYGLKRRQALRMNAAQQKHTYPDDTGFDHLSVLIADPEVWVSVAFQKQ